jgi:glutaredoxin
MDDVALYWMTGCATCRHVRDYLTREGVPFESVNISEGDDARDRWIAAGKPHVPAVSVGDRTASILHVSQVAPLVGLELPRAQDMCRMAWDILRIAEDWIEVVAGTDWTTLNAPTPVGDCSPLMFVTNSFPPIGMLAAAWDEGEFTWPGDHEVLLAEDRRVALAFRDHAAATDYMLRCVRPFRDLVHDKFTEQAPADRVVTTPDRGPVAFSALLAAQRWHAVFHLYQVVTFIGQRAETAPKVAAFSALADLEFPDDPFTP